MQKSIEYYMALPWQPQIDTTIIDGEATVRLQIPGISDFAVYGDAIEEVEEHWKDALESHLSGYLVCGKVIPEPPSIIEAITELPQQHPQSAEWPTLIVDVPDFEPA